MVGAVRLAALAEVLQRLVCTGNWAAAEPLLGELDASVASVLEAGAALVSTVCPKAGEVLTAGSSALLAFPGKAATPTPVARVTPASLPTRCSATSAPIW